MVLRCGGEVVADLPIAAAADGAPEYDRPHVPTPPRAAIDHDEVPARYDPNETLNRLMGGPNFSSRRWIREQYDSLVRGQTLRSLPAGGGVGRGGCMSSRKRWLPNHTKNKT